MLLHAGQLLLQFDLCHLLLACKPLVLALASSTSASLATLALAGVQRCSRARGARRVGAQLAPHAHTHGGEPQCEPDAPTTESAEGVLLVVCRVLCACRGLRG